MRRAVDSALLALSFLTIFPIRLREGATLSLGDCAPWFPLVGAGIGALAGGVRVGLDETLGATAASVLAVTMYVAITGALHLDGLADCADGLGVRGDRARRLAVMRDSAIGTFGTLALIAWALLAVTSVASRPKHDALEALVVAGAAGHWSALVHTLRTPPARTDGLGAAFAVDTPATIVATLLFATVPLTLLGHDGAPVLAVAAVAAVALAAWARRFAGGRTGDTIGAAVAITEVAVLLAVLGATST